MKTKLILIGIAMVFTQMLPGQKTDIKRLEPSSWWIGMHNPELMLMVYGNQIGNTEPQIKIAGVTVKEVKRADNPNYLFVFLHIDSSAQPGNYTLIFEDKKRKRLAPPLRCSSEAVVLKASISPMPFT